MKLKTVNKLLYNYKNGNVNVSIYEDGTKIREWPDNEEPSVEYPESCDCKITQYCDMDKICVYCFSPETSILLASGDSKSIKDIEIGDVVVSYNRESGDINTNPVYNIFERDVDEDIYEIELDNGEVVKVTGNHKFFTNIGEVRADELHEDLKIVRILSKS